MDVVVGNRNMISLFSVDTIIYYFYFPDRTNSMKLTAADLCTIRWRYWFGGHQRWRALKEPISVILYIHTIAAPVIMFVLTIIFVINKNTQTIIRLKCCWCWKGFFNMAAIPCNINITTNNSFTNRLKLLANKWTTNYFDYCSMCCRVQTYSLRTQITFIKFKNKIKRSNIICLSNHRLRKWLKNIPSGIICMHIHLQFNYFNLIASGNNSIVEFCTEKQSTMHISRLRTIRPPLAWFLLTQWKWNGW